MNILYLGDIMGRPGRDIVAKLLPGLREEFAVDLVIAQAENVSHGKSMSTHHMRSLQRAGIDFFTGGNHTTERPSIHALLADPNEPVIAPINQPGTEPSWGAKTIVTLKGNVLCVSLLGTIFPNVEAPMTNPLRAIDDVLRQTAKQDFVARIVNFHGDWSSEKRVVGYYLDGRVTAVIGDHWHVPTADAMVLPNGTAHITDVGMCGTLHSSLGIALKNIIDRWKDQKATKNLMDEDKPYQLNAVLVTVNAKTGLAKSITQIQKTLQ